MVYMLTTWCTYLTTKCQWIIGCKDEISSVLSLGLLNSIQTLINAAAPHNSLSSLSPPAGIGPLLHSVSLGSRKSAFFWQYFLPPGNISRRVSSRVSGGGACMPQQTAWHKEEDHQVSDTDWGGGGPFLTILPKQFQKGRAFHTGALVLALAKIEDIF